MASAQPFQNVIERLHAMSLMVENSESETEPEPEAQAELEPPQDLSATQVEVLEEPAAMEEVEEAPVRPAANASQERAPETSFRWRTSIVERWSLSAFC